MELLKRLVRVAGACGVRTLCYNWMPMNDWSRTSTTELERGGALVTAFDEEIAATSTAAVSGNTGDRDAADMEVASAEKLWDTLRRFLVDILPTCEDCGVVLAIHPDDPPLAVLNGRPQIVYSVAEAKKVVDLVPSPSNGVCFCVGTFAEAGEDIPAAIRLLGGDAIKFVHFRYAREGEVSRGEGTRACMALYHHHLESLTTTDVVVRVLSDKILFSSLPRATHSAGTSSAKSPVRSFASRGKTRVTRTCRK